MGRRIRIGNAGGFWGDDPDAPSRLLGAGGLDYLTVDYLAELTLAILGRQASESPALGYATDFPKIFGPLLPEILRAGVRVVVNAGGVNPSGCAAALEEQARALGVSPRIAVVLGDSLSLHSLELVRPLGGEGPRPDASGIVSANAYLGAFPVAAALGAGAQIVITGRVTDAALVLGPLVHEMGWKPGDWDELAGGLVAGHLLECGAQVTGGNHTDWESVPGGPKGYPIAIVEPDGSFLLTKPQGSGGIVSVDTIREQLLYEVQDPSAYVSPDVIADFSGLKLEGGPDGVRVSGAKGHEPPDGYKVSVTYFDGHKITGSVLVSGPRAVGKARRYAADFWERCPSLGRTHTELVGYSSFGGGFCDEEMVEEIELRLSAWNAEAPPLERFAKLLPALILAGPPGITFTGSLPKAQPVLSLWSGIVPKSVVSTRVALHEGGAVGVETPVAAGPPGAASRGPSGAGTQRAERASRPLAEVRQAGAVGEPLERLAFARSGDKGNSANIAVLARDGRAYAILEEWLTAQQVKDWFQERVEGAVTRYCAPKLFALNFVMEKALGGGGMASLRADALGKGLGQLLLRLRVPVPGKEVR